MKMRIGTMKLRITANLLIMALALVAFAGTTTRAQAITDKPNVVVVFVDDLGWTDLGVYGSKFYETPRIDQLAKQGAILKQHEIRDIVAFLATTGQKPVGEKQPLERDAGQGQSHARPLGKEAGEQEE